MDNTITAPDNVLDDDTQAESAILLLALAQSEGDLSDLLSESQLVEIGSTVIDDYEEDCSARSDWERIAKEALVKASQECERGEKSYPWRNASNVNYPLLTVAALQFNARSYPAIVRGDEAVSVKVVGSDKGLPQMGPDGQPVMVVNGQPVKPMQGAQGPVLVGVDGQPVQGEPEPLWARPPGSKASRAGRVKDYLNTHLFYRIDNWESDTDQLLIQLPIVGCAFRKVYYDPRERKHCITLVPALNLVAPMDAKDCATAARLSEVLPEQYPFEILEHMRSGYYRPASFVEGEKYTAARQLIEQHARFDLDGDGYPEPYVVTVDHESREVVRIVANFGMADVMAKDGKVIRITPRQFYVKYGFFPHPEGKFYDIGLGHLLEQIGGVVDTLINQMIDAGTAAVAGGGFIGSGVRLQGSNRSSVIRMAPGEWKPVNVVGDQLRNAMVERTVPTVAPVQFQLLEMLLGAAQDISSVKDVLTGDASNNGQVGTTLALIEQGLQMFTAIYKRVYRGLKSEFQLLFENLGKYGDEQTAQDYFNLLDDPQADFEADFNGQDMDIRPVSDPQTVTMMQRMAKSQFLGQFIGAPGLDSQAIIKRQFEAANVDDYEELFTPPPPPDPMAQANAQAEIQGKVSAANKDDAAAEKYRIEAAAKIAEEERKRLEAIGQWFREGLQAGS